MGTFAQNITATANGGEGGGTGFAGVAIDGTGNSIQADQGLITITGTVSSGTAGNSGISGYVAGVSIQDGAQIMATGTGGSISITGNASGSTAYDSSAADSSGSDEGIVIFGSSETNTIISVGTNGKLTLNGTGGTDDATYAADFDHTGDATGLDIGTGTQISGGDGATLTFTGQGGSAITNDGGLATLDTSFTGSAEGVDIGDNNGGGGIAQVTVGARRVSISITGTGGSMDLSNDATPGPDQDSDVQGAQITNGSLVSASGDSTIYLMGTGGTVTAGSSAFGSALGVDIGGEHTGQNTVVSSDSGLITIIGNGSDAPTKGIGVAVNGFNGGTAKVQSTSGNINITGTGGSGYNGGATVTTDYIPNYGVVVVDAATLQTGGSGTISLTGTGGGNGLGGSNSIGVSMVKLTNDPDTDLTPALPTISAGGAFTVSALSNTGIYVNGMVTAASATFGDGTAGNFASITSGPLVVLNSTVTLLGNFTAFGKGAGLDSDGLEIQGSTINAQGGTINLTGQAGYFIYENASQETALNGTNIAGEGTIIDTSTLNQAARRDYCLRRCFDWQPHGSERFDRSRSGQQQLKRCRRIDFIEWHGQQRYGAGDLTS